MGLGFKTPKEAIEGEHHFGCAVLAQGLLEELRMPQGHGGQFV